MTSQTKHLIDFSDILAFAFKCKQCGVVVSLPIAGNTKDKRLDKCPSCDEPWLVSDSEKLTDTFDQLRNHIRGFTQDMERRQKRSGGFSLSIEISAPASSGKD